MARATDLRPSDLRGVIGFLITPVKEQEITYRTQNAINVEETARATEALINDGVTGICLNGTFGELPSLTWEELKTFTATVVKTARKRVPVFAGATTLNTRDTIARAKEFRDMGADGLLMGRPMMSPLSDENIVRYYQDIAAELPEMAIFLYDDMEAFKRPITTRTYVELAKIPQIIAAKYRTRLMISNLMENTYNCDVDAVKGNIKLLPGDFDWYFANKLYGLDTCWSSSVCGGPAPIMALRDALNSQRLEEAQVITREISRLYEGIVPNGNFELWHVDKIPFMKARFAAAGYLKPGPALPPYHYISPARVEVAKECGRRSRELQEKYSRHAKAA